MIESEGTRGVGGAPQGGGAIYDEDEEDEGVGTEGGLLSTVTLLGTLYSPLLLYLWTGFVVTAIVLIM